MALTGPLTDSKNAFLLCSQSNDQIRKSRFDSGDFKRNSLLLLTKEFSFCACVLNIRTFSDKNILHLNEVKSSLYTTILVNVHSNFMGLSITFQQ